MNPIVHGLYHVKEWDKKMARNFKISLDLQLSNEVDGLKGFIIGAILL